MDFSFWQLIIKLETPMLYRKLLSWLPDKFFFSPSLFPLTSRAASLPTFPLFPKISSTGSLILVT